MPSQLHYFSNVFQNYEDTLERALFGVVLRKDSVAVKHCLLTKKPRAKKSSFPVRLRNFARVHRLKWNMSFILYPMNSKEKRYISKIVINTLLGETSTTFAYGKDEEEAKTNVCAKVLKDLLSKKELIKQGHFMEDEYW